MAVRGPDPATGAQVAPAPQVAPVHPAAPPTPEGVADNQEQAPLDKPDAVVKDEEELLPDWLALI